MIYGTILQHAESDQGVFRQEEARCQVQVGGAGAEVGGLGYGGAAGRGQEAGGGGEAGAEDGGRAVGQSEYGCKSKCG